MINCYIMIDKFLYEDYEIGFNEGILDDADSYFFIFNNKRELFLDSNNELPFTDKSFLSHFDVNFVLFFGRYRGRSCYTVSVSDDDDYFKLFQVYDINRDVYQVALRALLINDWYDNNRFCGHCGAGTVLKENSMSLVCPECGGSFHGHVQPAVIVAVTRDDKLLMACHSYDTRVRYALIAGFVEMGETLEECVKREVKEEVGINVRNVEYVASQPWFMGSSLMCGYKAEYESGSISVDGDEIVDARWFSSDEIEDIDSDLSIYSLLVEDFKSHSMDGK